jgi:3-oxoacyl-[acyl-carrier protein] reductase
MTQLAGQSVVVTGAGGGVGRGVALGFGAAGAGVVVAAHRRKTGEAVAEEIRGRGGQAVCVECDVTKRTDIEGAVAAAVGHYGGLDAFIHNATSNRSNEPVDLETASRQLWEDHASVSIRALLYCAQAAHRPLADRQGSLLIMLSPAGIQGGDRLPFYATVKGAQRGFVKSLAREWGMDGIRVNGLAPLAMTPALEGAFRNDPEMHDRLARVIPLHRFGDPEADIAPAAIFLCSDAARYVVGQTLVVSGGRFTAL